MPPLTSTLTLICKINPLTYIKYNTHIFLFLHFTKLMSRWQFYWCWKYFFFFCLVIRPGAWKFSRKSKSGQSIRLLQSLQRNSVYTVYAVPLECSMLCKCSMEHLQRTITFFYLLIQSNTSSDEEVVHIVQTAAAAVLAVGVALKNAKQPYRKNRAWADAFFKFGG